MRNRFGRWFKVVALSMVAVGLINAPSIEAATKPVRKPPAIVPPLVVLVDDFSQIDAYTIASALNPYHAQATLPLWCGGSCPPIFSEGDIAFHTNNVGYYTSAHTDAGENTLVYYDVKGGRLILVWEHRPYTPYWYSALASNGQAMDLAAYANGYLTFRVVGGVGGEQDYFRIKLGTTNGSPISQTLLLTDYVQIQPDNGLPADWHKAVIPMADFDGAVPGQPFDYSQVTSVTLEFLDPRGYPQDPNATEIISIDDLTFEIDLNYVPPTDGVVKPVSTGPVQVIGQQLRVNGQPFRIQGVGYQTTPIGQTPHFGSFNPYIPENVTRDFDLICNGQTPCESGINTVRAWTRFDYWQVDPGDGTLLRYYDNTALLDSGADTYGIKVIAGMWIPYEISMANDWAKTRIQEEFISFVNARKNEPSILMWVIGNENNLRNGYDWRWYDFANTLAREAYMAEGAAYHPAAIVDGADVVSLGQPAMASDDAHLNYVDVIGFNAYFGKQWAPFFSTFESLTSKPLWISEFGADAYHTNNPQDPDDGSENQVEQADYDVKAWVELVRRSDRVVGATVMAYADEWWKYTDPQWTPAEIGANLLVQNTGGFHYGPIRPGALPDDFMNEEYWGLVSIADNGSDPDTVSPRLVFEQLYSPTIGGRVSDSVGQTIAGATVTASLDGNPVGTTQTDAAGAYVFSQLSLGTYTIVATATGIGQGQATAVLTESANQIISDITVYAPPVADFSGTPLTGIAPLTVQFTDISTGQIDSWSWQFGDGQTSSQQSPQHLYQNAGTYNVSLTVTGQGGTDTETKNGYITVLPPGGSPDFSLSGLTVSGLLTTDLTVNVTVHNNGTGASPATIVSVYTNRFGGAQVLTPIGNIAVPVIPALGQVTLQQTLDTSVIFSHPGMADFIIAIADEAGVISETDETNNEATVNLPLIAGFTGTPLQGTAPLTVQFTNWSSGWITGFSWNFGDGGTSTLPSPSHVYTQPGTYTVSLTITAQGGGTDVETKVGYVVVSGPLKPTLTFTATPSQIISGQSTFLAWQSQNAAGCTASGGWTGKKAKAGAQAVKPTKITTYSFTCSGAGGTVTKSVTVNVVSTGPKQ